MMLRTTLLLLASVSSTTFASTVTRHALARRLEVINESKEKVSVEWVHPTNGNSVPLGAPTSGARVAFDSFVNHTFIIRPLQDEVNGKSTSQKVGAAENVTIYKVKETQGNQVLIVREGREGLIVENVQREEADMEQDHTNLVAATAEMAVKKCRDAAQQALQNKRKRQSQKQIMDDLTECLQNNTALVLMDQNEELQKEAEMRREMSRRIENYTCADPERESSPPLRVDTWTHNGLDREVHILHDRPSSQIHMLKNFVSEEECQEIQKRAAPTLHRGTVADGKGGSQMSTSRKAWQAGLKVDWSKEKDGDLLAAVTRRLFDYTQHAVGYNMTVEGQEDLMSIQYFGEKDAETPDRYLPHCDGACDGLSHKTGARVATMVMYCDVPTLGGGTNFQNSNVFVRATKGAAAFFSYLNNETLHTDDGFTLHSGCPVLEGTKRIAVQWMRVGVSADLKWDDFDTNTVNKKSKDYDDY